MTTVDLVLSTGDFSKPVSLDVDFACLKDRDLAWDVPFDLLRSNRRKGETVSLTTVDRRIRIEAAATFPNGFNGVCGGDTFPEQEPDRMVVTFWICDSRQEVPQ